MIKYIIVLGLIFFSLNFVISTPKKAGPSRIETLLYQLPTVNEDTIKLKILTELSFEYYTVDPNEGIKYGELALSLSNKLNMKQIKAEVLINLGANYWSLSDFNKALENFSKSLEIYTELNDKKGISKTLNNLGMISQIKSDYPKALEYFKKALQINEELGNQNSIGTNLVNIGLIYSNLSQTSQSLEYFQKSLKIFKKMGNKYGEALNLDNIGNCYKELSDYPKALDYYQQGLTIFEELGIKPEIARNFGSTGMIYCKQSEYSKALEYCQKSLKINEDIGNKFGVAQSSSNIAIIYWYQENFVKAIEYNQNALKIYEEIENKAGLGGVLVDLGLIYWKQKDYLKATDYLQRALNIFEELGDKSGVALSLGNIANIYLDQFDYLKSLDYYQKALNIYSELHDQNGIAANLGNIGDLYLRVVLDTLKNSQDTKVFNNSNKEQNLKRGIDSLEKAIDILHSIGNRSDEGLFLASVSIAYKELGDYKKAYETFYYSKVIQDSIFSFESQKKIANLETKKDLEIQQKNNERLKVDSSKKVSDLLLKEKQVQLLNKQKSLQNLEIDRKNLLLKSKNNELRMLEKDKKLNELSLREKNVENEKNAKSLKLKELEVLQARNERLALIGGLASLLFIIFFVIRERSRSEKLLLNILPKKIASRLKRKEKFIADRFEEASVIFIDQVSFTSKSKDMEPEELVANLDELYSQFDALADKYGLEKIKTIGDCYMAAAGIPELRSDHAEATSMFAIEAMALSNKEVKFRCGIDCGPVVAGVIGKKKFIYDLWGDTVNTASRMESYGEAGKIQVTERFKEKIEGKHCTVSLHERGEIEIKGKGMMRTWFLEKIH